MIMRATDNYISNYMLFDFLNENRIKYTFHTYPNGITTYKIYTDNEEHLTNIDEILELKNNDKIMGG